MVWNLLLLTVREQQRTRIIVEHTNRALPYLKNGNAVMLRRGDLL